MKPPAPLLPLLAPLQLSVMSALNGGSKSAALQLPGVLFALVAARCAHTGATRFPLRASNCAPGAAADEQPGCAKPVLDLHVKTASDT